MTRVKGTATTKKDIQKNLEKKEMTSARRQRFVLDLAEILKKFDALTGRLDYKALMRLEAAVKRVVKYK